MIKKITTFLSLFISGSFAFSALTASSKSSDKDIENISNNLRKQLRQEIINNSEKISTKQYLQYDDIDFENDEQLNQYLAKQNKIEKIITSTNLGKIVKDYEFKLLDNEKIYSVNIDDYKIVYKDRYGNAVLDKQEALKSYNSEIRIQKRYNHPATDSWHSSKEEAAEIKPTGEKSYLYIYLNNKYFNVINDREALLSNLTSGYYVNKSKFTGTKGKEKDIFGTKEYIKKTIRKSYERTWIKDDLLNYVDVIPEYKVKIKKKNNVLLRVNDQYLPEYTLNGGTNKHIKVKNVLSDKKWNYNDERYSCATKKIATKEFKNSQKVGTVLTIIPNGGHWYCYTSIASPSVDLEAIDISSVTYNLYKTKTGKDQKDKSQLLDSIEDDVRLSDINNTPTHIRKKFYKRWFNEYFFDNEFINLSTTSSSNPINEYGVQKDSLYRLNSSYSDKSFLSFKESSDKFHTKIKPGLKNENGNYTIQGNKFTEEQINKYLYLDKYPFYRKMYNHSNSDNLTSYDGSLLSSTRWEANEKTMHYNKAAIDEKYFIYHLEEFKPELSAGTHEETVEMFSKTLKLEAKYVHKNEIESWKNKTVSFNSIVSDGRYAAYRIIKKNKGSKQTISYFYYNSYDDALKSIRKAEEHKITIVNKYIKIYFYKDKNNVSHLFTYKDDKEINEIIDKIINLD